MPYSNNKKAIASSVTILLWLHPTIWWALEICFSFLRIR